MLALGLLEDPQNKRAISLPRKVEAFHRFLLSQLDKEAKEPDIPPALLSHHTDPPAKVLELLCLYVGIIVVGL